MIFGRVMGFSFFIRFLVICIVAGLLNAAIIVSVYLAANGKLGSSEVVINSYRVGAMIALVFYGLAFFAPNFRAHQKLLKHDKDDYLSTLNSELQNRKLYKLVLSNWFLNKWRDR